MPMRSSVKLILGTIGLLTFFLFFFSISSQNEVGLPGWANNVTRNASQYIKSDTFSTEIVPKNICDKQSFLLMIVCSAPSNFEARSAIRKTWGREQSILGRNISTYFLMGRTANLTTQKQLLLESSKFNDIIQEDFIDSYRNLTLKSIQMLKIVSNYCMGTTTYLLKIDDDMLVNVPLLIRVLTEKKIPKNILMGKKIHGARPIRDPESKWYTPKYMYKGAIYPDYLSGTGYLMSTDVAKKLFEVTSTVPLLHLEDIFLTGICSKKAGIKLEACPFFTYHYMDHEICEYRRLITMHHFPPEMLLRIYDNLIDPNLETLCQKYIPVFSTHKWLLDNVLKPNRMYRKNIC